MVRRSRTILVWFERRHDFQIGDSVEQCSRDGGRLLTRWVIVYAGKARSVNYRRPAPVSIL